MESYAQRSTTNPSGRPLGSGYYPVSLRVHVTRSQHAAVLRLTGSDGTMAEVLRAAIDHYVAEVTAAAEGGTENPLTPVRPTANL